MKQVMTVTLNSRQRTSDTIKVAVHWSPISGGFPWQMLDLLTLFVLEVRERRFVTFFLSTPNGFKVEGKNGLAYCL